MNLALSFLTSQAGEAPQGIIDRLQSYVDKKDEAGAVIESVAQQQLADPDYWSSVGMLTLIGILVVFFILAILIAIFWGMGKFFEIKDKRKKAKAEAAKAAAAKAAAAKAEPAAAPAEAVEQAEEYDDSDDDEIIAVISAAIAAYSEQDGKQYAIRSIKRKDNKTRSAWSLAGIGDNTRPF